MRSRNVHGSDAVCSRRPTDEVRALDTIAAIKEVLPQPAPPGCGISTSATAEPATAVSPEEAPGSVDHDTSAMIGILERNIETAAEHSEIVLWSVDHSEAQVVSPTDMSRDSEFETGSELAEHLGLASEVICFRMDGERIRRALRVNDIPFATAEDRADTSPGIGC